MFPEHLFFLEVCLLYLHLIIFSHFLLILLLAVALVFLCLLRLLNIEHTYSRTERVSRWFRYTFISVYVVLCVHSSNKFHMLFCSDQGLGQTDQLSYLGLPVLFNPPKDGNCQLEAAAHQLRNIGRIVTGDACREAAVEWICRNKSKLREFTATDKKQYV